MVFHLLLEVLCTLALGAPVGAMVASLPVGFASLFRHMRVAQKQYATFNVIVIVININVNVNA